MPFRTSAEYEAAIPDAIGHLLAGGLLAHPTETVYGFGCVLEAAPLERLAQLKGGREDRAFLVLVGDPAHAPGLRWTEAAEALANAFWPGPLTIVLAQERAYPARAAGAGGTVAVRWTAHPGMQRLLRTLAAPVTSTSANLPGQPPALSADEVGSLVTNPVVAANFLLLDGGVLEPSAPSTLVDCSEPVPRLLRAGAIPLDELKRWVHDLRS
ncbi:MAG: L-threonylcarbamoyladenylate synthase [Longimicrobiales bacterium]